MHAWQVPYLGWRRLPADLSEFEIAHFFSLRPEEIRAVLTKYGEALRLGAALQIGFLKMCGRPLDVIQRVPTDLLKHLADQLEVPAPTIATLRALYLRRRRTLYEHQRWAIEFLGLVRFESTDLVQFQQPIGDLVRAGLSGDHLHTAIRKLLFEGHYVVPGPRRVAAVAVMAVSHVEADCVARIERDIPVYVRDRWIESLSGVVTNGLRATLIE